MNRKNLTAAVLAGLAGMAGRRQAADFRLAILCIFTWIPVWRYRFEWISGDLFTARQY